MPTRTEYTRVPYREFSETQSNQLLTHQSIQETLEEGAAQRSQITLNLLDARRWISFDDLLQEFGAYVTAGQDVTLPTPEELQDDLSALKDIGVVNSREHGDHTADLQRLVDLAGSLTGEDRRLEPMIALAVKDIKTNANDMGAEGQIRLLLEQKYTPEQIEFALNYPHPDFEYSGPLEKDEAVEQEGVTFTLVRYQRQEAFITLSAKKAAAPNLEKRLLNMADTAEFQDDPDFSADVEVAELSD